MKSISKPINDKYLTTLCDLLHIDKVYKSLCDTLR